jgi:hypothetical protein
MRTGVVAAAAAVALAAIGDSHAAGATRSHETAVGVSLREFRVAPYRDRVRPGAVKLNVMNYGEDAHDLVVRTRRGTVLAHLPELRPGDRSTLRVRLRRPGRYVLACTLGDHERRGMRAWLTASTRR